MPRAFLRPDANHYANTFQRGKPASVRTPRETASLLKSTNPILDGDVMKPDSGLKTSCSTVFVGRLGSGAAGLTTRSLIGEAVQRSRSCSSLAEIRSDAVRLRFRRVLPAQLLRRSCVKHARKGDARKSEGKNQPTRRRLW
mmetsp:Transcript_25120/g.63154  ORF Transcript_25120/g.63154 Transcript_25120/m.63154 type:complete len:141 (+) Transcript_25120:3398-3820(+)